MLHGIVTKALPKRSKFPNSREASCWCSLSGARHGLPGFTIKFAAMWSHSHSIWIAASSAAHQRWLHASHICRYFLLAGVQPMMRIRKGGLNSADVHLPPTTRIGSLRSVAALDASERVLHPVAAVECIGMVQV